MEYPFIAITPKSTLVGVVPLERVPSIGSIELVDHITVCKQMTDVKLNYKCHIAILGTI